VHDQLKSGLLDGAHLPDVLVVERVQNLRWKKYRIIDLCTGLTFTLVLLQPMGHYMYFYTYLNEYLKIN
jgi:hypothetical protein